ncbi:hypothetical protein ACLI09_13140 [Flavobacterium sp. RHBU_24]|uniref:hypothetical protein n=1 Tax=Flavobacterium sp. RHBU_24 TaxID=3391185 RepID=UPI0039849008
MKKLLQLLLCLLSLTALAQASSIEYSQQKVLFKVSFDKSRPKAYLWKSKALLPALPVIVVSIA